MTTKIKLFEALPDWLTITSFEPSAWALYDSIWKSILSGVDDYKITEDSKRQQYVGMTLHLDNGTIFAGEATQNGRYHTMLQASGGICESVFPHLTAGIKERWLRCRRLDFQMTIPLPENWNQWRFFNRMKKRNRNVGWIESQGNKIEELSTVYVGSRKSEKFRRLYVKEANDGVGLLRYEVEVKANAAESLALSLAKMDHSLDRLLLFDVQRQNDDKLSAIFEPPLNGIKPQKYPKIIKIERKTAVWLRESVYHAFVREINDHDADGEILELFSNAIEKTKSHKGLI